MRIIYGLWLIVFSVVITNAYKGLAISKLTLPLVPESIEYFDNLTKTRSVDLTIYKKLRWELEYKPQTWDPEVDFKIFAKSQKQDMAWDNQPNMYYDDNMYNHEFSSDLEVAIHNSLQNIDNICRYNKNANSYANMFACASKLFAKADILNVNLVRHKRLPRRRTKAPFLNQDSSIKEEIKVVTKVRHPFHMQNSKL